MWRPAVTLASLLIALFSARAGATFHEARIGELMSGVGADATTQYVEIEIVGPDLLQGSVAGTRLTAFTCAGTSHAVLLQVPFNVTDGTAPARWIMATKNPVGGISPDFTWDPSMTGSIPNACGMVCWGAPGAQVPNPASWDAGNPNNYVDCVAYGGYTGPRKTAPGSPGGPTSGTPTNLAAGDGSHSLTRMSDASNNLTDFRLACPTPTNNAGASGSFGSCTPPTTTTTVSATTTTTTLAGRAACRDPQAVANTRAQVNTQCECAGASSHGAYVKCAAAVVTAAVTAHTLPKACKGAVKRCAANSICGKPGFVTCCRSTARGVHTCSIKRSAAACKAPKRGSACVGNRPSCCDACATASCAASAPPITSTTTLPRTTTTLRSTTTTMRPYGY